MKEPLLPDFSAANHENLMKHRIHRILLVCSSYDQYILEEDGHIESQIMNEYRDLNMSNPPSLKRVDSAAAALEELSSGQDEYDFVLTLYNVGEMSVFEFAENVKKLDPEMPVVFLTSFSKEINRQIEEHSDNSIDNMFCWHGNAELITAIIKLMEDKLNAESDILEGGVQAILLVEDSIRFYSTYLPELYRILLLQNSEFLKDAYNENQLISRKRARPKVLLATNYSEAVALFQKYEKNLLGVITDIGMVVNAGDPPETEKFDAGIDICRLVKKQNPWMPVIMQSSQESFKADAKALKAHFISKKSKTLLGELQEIIRSEFGFGPFLFRNPADGKVLATATNLMELQDTLEKVSDEILEHHLSQMSLSKWLYARGLFPIAKVLRRINSNDFTSTAEHRAAIISLIRDYRRLLGQGIVVQFDDATYSDSIGFARVGDGSIGGKARGLSFMNNLLGRDGIYYKYPNLRILIPRSLVVATDYFDMFIKVNDLDYVISQDLSDELILHEFLNGVLPSGLYAKLKVFVMTCSKPLAIRSSSKLEDSNYQPFAGIYSTYMIPRCENDDQMLRLLVRAIKSVYASVYMSSAKAYIQSSQNVLGEEKMAVLIQEVCGSEENGYYFPTLAGVARSINSYPIGYEKPEDGVCNMVMGLGKAVVDGEKSFRFCPAYPDKALQTSTLELTLSEAQNEVLALNLNPHSFLPSVDDGINIVRLPISRIADYRNTKHTCSYYDFTNGRICESRPFDRFYKVITFNRILKYDSIPLAQVISDLLKIGEREMRTPVEIEFAVDMDVAPGTLPVFNLLQIRPIIANNEGGKIDWDKVNTEDAICYSNDALGIGLMKGLRKVIYVKFDKFSTLITQKIADELYTLNAGFEGEYILIGTGRWGSSIPSLGIPVKWQHISKARVIVESAIPGFNIEASQGSHFFQNVTSLGIGYVSLNPSAGDGILDIAALDAMPAIYDGEYLRCVEFDSDLFVCVDGKNKKAIIKKGDA